MSKHNSEPISDFLRRSLAFARRSRRRRSKSTLFSQSTAIVPYVGRAIEFSFDNRSEVRGQIAEVNLASHWSDLPLPSTECTRGLEHGQLRWNGDIFQGRRERNWNMHCAHALDRSVQIVECAGGNHRRKFRSHAIAFVTFVEDNCPRRFLG